MGDHIAVFRHGQQFISTAGAGFRGCHFTRQRSKARNVQADGFQHDINRFQELIAMEVFQTCQIDAGATFIDFVTQAVETFFPAAAGSLPPVCVAGGHVTFGFDNAGFQQPFLLISEHPVAAILHGLTTPPWAHLMQYTFVLFAYRKACARSVGEVVDLFFSIRETVYSGKIGAARTSLARLPMISSSCLIQMVRSAR